MRTGLDGAFARGLAAGVTLLVGGVEAARADIISQPLTFTIGPADANGSQPLTFDLFAAGLGTLNSATFTLDSSTTTTVTMDAASNEGSAFAQNQGTFTVSVTSPALDDLFPTFDSTLISTGCSTRNVDCDTSTSNTDAFDDTDPVAGADLAELIGAGNFDVTFAYTTSPEVTQCIGGCTPGGSVAWSGSLTLTYDYTPASTSSESVPEPATLALLGTGLFGAGLMGLIRRRRRARGVI